MVLAARLDAATSVAGDGFELDVIAAVVIGDQFERRSRRRHRFAHRCLNHGCGQKRFKPPPRLLPLAACDLRHNYPRRGNSGCIKEKGCIPQSHQVQGVIKGDPDQVQESI